MIESKQDSSLPRLLHRFRCLACGRVGCWLSSRDDASANEQAHENWHGAEVLEAERRARMEYTR